MDIVKGFFDYCISDECANSKDFEAVLKRLLKLGYRTVAINQVISEEDLAPKKKKKKKETKELVDVVPEPIEIPTFESCAELKVLNRLTVAFSNQDIIHKITKSPNFKKYHILAILPLSQAAFQFTCNSIDADIFCFDPENKLPFKLSRKLYNQLAEKGFYFEILYSPAIQDSTKRKNVIKTSHLLHSFGKSKNIIVSSGTRNEILLRSPYDIINLGLIFGLSEDQAKNAVLNNGRSVYLHAVGRRHGKAVMLVENLDKIQSESEEEEMEVEQPKKKLKQ